MRFVLDTNIVVSGLRSPSGASAALLDRALSRVFTLLLSVALVLEYEAAAKDSEQLIASGLSEAEVATVLASLCAVAEPVYCWFLWRPQLRDPADEMVPLPLNSCVVPGAWRAGCGGVYGRWRHPFAWPPSAR